MTFCSNSASGFLDFILVAKLLHYFISSFLHSPLYSHVFSRFVSLALPNDNSEHPPRLVVRAYPQRLFLQFTRCSFIFGQFTSLEKVSVREAQARVMLWTAQIVLPRMGCVRYTAHATPRILKSHPAIYQGGAFCNCHAIITERYYWYLNMLNCEFDSYTIKELKTCYLKNCRRDLFRLNWPI